MDQACPHPGFAYPAHVIKILDISFFFIFLFPSFPLSPPLPSLPLSLSPSFSFFHFFPSKEVWQHWVGSSSWLSMSPLSSSQALPPCYPLGVALPSYMTHLNPTGDWLWDIYLLLVLSLTPDLWGSEVSYSLTSGISEAIRSNQWDSMKEYSFFLLRLVLLSAMRPFK